MISTKGRYAIRLMLDLAENSTGTPIPLDAIATRQDISKKYLEAIVRLLVKGKLVKATSGKGGGYFLTRSPEEYSIYDILELTESSLSSVACLEKDAEECPKKKMCRTVSMWAGYNKVTKDYFSNITIKDLL